MEINIALSSLLWAKEIMDMPDHKIYRFLIQSGETPCHSLTGPLYQLTKPKMEYLHLWPKANFLSLIMLLIWLDVLIYGVALSDPQQPVLWQE